jgi:hypothetical protein
LRKLTPLAAAVFAAATFSGAGALARPPGPAKFCETYPASKLCVGGPPACSLCHEAPPTRNLYGAS